ncbi:glutathione S-transferase [Capronia epimyces CBS 606.96]|uniref:Glutathione S-transferase n=1 Tax=Capronia epimyces CBS 606.96 TaxID=1182542 RepID=W9YIN4_9EURO|nr:glutathione S-transferase [Capronia epimyces CBS 606.96]EXJ89535.1 glutathione S-transferase [Capronia epimyces CBS 606.96]
MPYAVTVPDGYGTARLRPDLTEDHSYVVLIALGLAPLLSWVQGTVVTTLRKPAGVAYPNAYATAQQVKESRDAYKFNCAQRAHANLLENMPQTMLFMLFAGLEYPRAAAALGAAWLLCRIIYAYGYIASEKNGKGRMYGGGFWLMQACLWALSATTALRML